MATLADRHRALVSSYNQKIQAQRSRSKQYKSIDQKLRNRTPLSLNEDLMVGRIGTRKRKRGMAQAGESRASKAIVDLLNQRSKSLNILNRLGKGFTESQATQSVMQKIKREKDLRRSQEKPRSTKAMGPRKSLLKESYKYQSNSGEIKTVGRLSDIPASARGVVDVNTGKTISRSSRTKYVTVRGQRYKVVGGRFIAEGPTIGEELQKIKDRDIKVKDITREGIVRTEVAPFAAAKQKKITQTRQSKEMISNLRKKYGTKGNIPASFAVINEKVQNLNRKEIKTLQARLTRGFTIVENFERLFKKIPGLKGERYVQRFARDILAFPARATVGTGIITSAAVDNISHIIKDIKDPYERAAATHAVYMAAKATPLLLLRSFNPVEPEGLVNLLALGLYGGYRAAKYVKTKVQNAGINVDLTSTPPTAGATAKPNSIWVDRRTKVVRVSDASGKVFNAGKLAQAGRKANSKVAKALNVLAKRQKKSAKKGAKTRKANEKVKKYGLDPKSLAKERKESFIKRIEREISVIKRLDKDILVSSEQAKALGFRSMRELRAYQNAKTTAAANKIGARVISRMRKKQLAALKKKKTTRKPKKVETKPAKKSIQERLDAKARLIEKKQTSTKLKLDTKAQKLGFKDHLQYQSYLKDVRLALQGDVFAHIRLKLLKRKVASSRKVSSKKAAKAISIALKKAKNVYVVRKKSRISAERKLSLKKNARRVESAAIDYVSLIAGRKAQAATARVNEMGFQNRKDMNRYLRSARRAQNGDAAALKIVDILEAKRFKYLSKKKGKTQLRKEIKDALEARRSYARRLDSERDMLRAQQAKEKASPSNKLRIKKISAKKITKTITKGSTEKEVIIQKGNKVLTIATKERQAAIRKSARRVESSAQKFVTLMKKNRLQEATRQANEIGFANRKDLQKYLRYSGRAQRGDLVALKVIDTLEIKRFRYLSKKKGRAAIKKEIKDTINAKKAYQGKLDSERVKLRKEQSKEAKIIRKVVTKKKPTIKSIKTKELPKGQKIVIQKGNQKVVIEGNQIKKYKTIEKPHATKQGQILITKQEVLVETKVLSKTKQSVKQKVQAAKQVLKQKQKQKTTQRQILAQKQKVRTITKTQLQFMKLKYKTLSKLLPFLAFAVMGQKVAVATKQGLLQQQKTATKIAFEQIYRLAIAQAQRVATKTATKVATTQKQITKTITKGTTKKKPVIQKPKIPKRGKLFIPAIRLSWSTKLKSGRVHTAGYRVRSGGVNRNYGGSLTMNRAIRDAIKRVDQSTARSFSLIVSGSTANRDIKKPVALKKFRIRKGKDPRVLTFVEKAKYAIDSPIEKAQLRSARKRKRRNRNVRSKKSKTR